jgi:hypothetical protein
LVDLDTGAFRESETGIGRLTLLVESDILGRAGQDFVLVGLPVLDALRQQNQAPRRGVRRAGNPRVKIRLLKRRKKVAFEVFAGGLDHPIGNLFGTDLQQELSH